MTAPIAPNAIPSLAAWFKSDVGVTLATGVSAWADQSGAGRNLVQASGGLQPSFASNVVASKPALTFDGADDFLQVAFALAQPTAIYLVMRPNVLVAGDTYVDGAAAVQSMAIEHAQVTPNRLRINAGSNLTATPAMPVNTWGITTAFFDGVSSFIETADNVGLSGNAGATAGGGITLGARQDGTLAAGFSVAELVVFSAIPSTPNRAGLRAYFRDRYSI
ncbi:MAG: hypothetical protein ACK53W_01755 [Gemmatimonadota bacterium]|jgi:hypothetical protein